MSRGTQAHESSTESGEVEAPFAALQWTPAIGRLIDLALEEDLGRGDVTTEALGERREGQAILLCRVPVTVCGMPLGRWLLQRGAPELQLTARFPEGASAPAGATIGELSGPVDAMLRLERTLLNFLMRQCGVATLTRRYLAEVEGTGACIADTRKTIPGWRALDKYAVRAGGGRNHRCDLGSGILIKDNHIAACGSVTEAVAAAKRRAPHPLRVEVEVESLAAVREAVQAGAEILLLDNMSPAMVREAVGIARGRALLEVSGGVTLATVRAYAEAGADIISVGALTHSAPAVDLSLDLSPESEP